MSFAYSRFAAFYSYLFYRPLQISLALARPHISGGLIRPQSQQDPSKTDAFLPVAGAGPSIETAIGKGVFDFASGDFGGGAKAIIRNAPFTRLWFWKDIINQQTRGWGL